MAVPLQMVCSYLNRLAPRRLAEDWDNIGLLVGRRDSQVQRIMTCLTVTPESAAEAQRREADLIVTHHPLPFRAIKRLTDDTTAGALLLELIAHRIAVFSSHTAYDSAERGINQQLALALGVAAPKPLRPLDGDPEGLGAGRFGDLSQPKTGGELAQHVCAFLKIDAMQAAGDAQVQVKRLAVACGAAGEFLPAAIREGCQVLVTGETNFHTCLEAKATGTLLLLTGHFASERFAVEQLADWIGEEFPSVEVFASQDECDPLWSVHAKR